ESVPWSRRRFLEQRDVALVALAVDLTFVDGGADCAARLVRVCARAREAALSDQVAELREMIRQLGGFDLPESELAQPRCIRDVAAALERDESRGHCRVLAFVHRLAHIADAQSQPGLHGIQQTRL